MPSRLSRSVPAAGLAVLVVAALAVRAAAQEPPRSGQSGRAETVEPWIDTALHWVTRAVEFAGIAVIVVGAVVTTAVYLRHKLRGVEGEQPYHEYRAGLGRSILLGLEFLVAADIIATVAVEPTLDSVVVLAGIVLIRTFLSFALEVEIEGRWPWQNANGAPAASRKGRGDGASGGDEAAKS